MSADRLTIDGRTYTCTDGAWSMEGERIAQECWPFLDYIAQAKTGAGLPEEPRMVGRVRKLEDKNAGEIATLEYIDALRAVASGLVAQNQRLKDCLNHAVSELARAALSENFEADDCLTCMEQINDTLKPMGTTSDWHTLENWYDRLCAAAGVDNGDEIDILPIAEKMLREHSAAEQSAQVSKERAGELETELKIVQEEYSEYRKQNGQFGAGA